MKYHKIPQETIRRMPMYLRAFSLLKTEEQPTISSRQLALRLHLNPPQIRKDLSYFGAFGTRGIGYPVAATAERLRGILKLDVPQKAALVGAGRLGNAIASYPGFATFGFEIAAIFDNADSKIGQTVGKIVVEDTARIGTIRNRGIHLAILAVPAEAAQAVADKLVAAGAKGILNLSPCYLEVPRRVKVVTIDIAMELGTLPYYM
ncbi:MAG: redox-sensing transcriptional repressor Rex [Planctomycetales bacterium]|nr:redox-sensing transcriptional repressor Rex [Planctomycetales bacterium]